MYRIIAVLLSFLISNIYLFGQINSWHMKTAPLMTKWAGKIDTQNVLPEYPRPQLKRSEWKNLNGIWEFQETAAGQPVPFGKILREKILVPFPWESALSGIHKFLTNYRAWYRRTFKIPKEWEGKDIILNFGAVDWKATVYINKSCVAIHKGGYDAFSINITPYLKKNGVNELIVGVYDPGSSKGIPTGKQSNDRFNNPHGYSYTSSSGIWQTVWIEPVSHINYIKDIKITTNIDSSIVTLKCESELVNNNSKVLISVFDGEKIVTSKEGRTYEDITIPIKNERLWSPDSPFLYNLEIKLQDSSGINIDQVSSYFGMRKIALSFGRGLKRIYLNNKFLFQIGPLDQGYWPDGIYTAPTDEALKWDIQNIKKFGFNMIRKHVKVEPPRWYYWCDKLGVLVWQDMPSTFHHIRSEEEKTQFELELQQMIKTHWNHPSIIVWIIFNEHWGIFDVKRITDEIQSLDPTRLVTPNSGMSARKPPLDYEVGDIKDQHHYRPPACPIASTVRAVVCGEYGAIGYKIKGHIWDTDGPWVHDTYADKKAATEEYVKFIKEIKNFRDTKGLSAAVYTQWTDVENEMNGIYTYDRKVVKLDQEIITKVNKSTYEKNNPIEIK